MDFVKSAFSSRKGAFATNPVSSRSKKKRLFDSWYYPSDKIKNAPLTRLFSIFCKNVIFTKNKGAFFLNGVSALYFGGKGALFSKSMDFQLSLEKKINALAILVNFSKALEIIHKNQFWSCFFIKVIFLSKLHFFCSFLRLVVWHKWTWKKGAFDSRGFKKYFQRAEGSEKLIMLWNSISKHSFSKTRLLYLKIALFYEKVTEIQLFCEKQKARFYIIEFWSSNVSKRLIQMYDEPSQWLPLVSKELIVKKRLFKTLWNIQ